MNNNPLSRNYSKKTMPETKKFSRKSRTWRMKPITIWERSKTLTSLWKQLRKQPTKEATIMTYICKSFSLSFLGLMRFPKIGKTSKKSAINYAKNSWSTSKETALKKKEFFSIFSSWSQLFLVVTIRFHLQTFLSMLWDKQTLMLWRKK